MLLPEKEKVHVISILHEAKNGLLEKDATKLKELSNNTIHNACNYQDSASITIAVMVYALSKFVERQDHVRFKSWDAFVKKIVSYFDLAIKAIEDDNQDAYENYVSLARKTFESQSISLKSYIQDVMKKASINKGSKIYEHGISLEQTSKLLGVTQWELSDYIGERAANEAGKAQTFDVRKRVKMAMEFFS